MRAHGVCLNGCSEQGYGGDRPIRLTGVKQVIPVSGDSLTDILTFIFRERDGVCSLADAYVAVGMPSFEIGDEIQEIVSDDLVVECL